MVEVKSNSVGEELLQELKSLFTEIHKTYPISIEGYIQCGEYYLGQAQGNKKLFDAITRLGDFGKLILGCLNFHSHDGCNYYVEFHEERVTEDNGENSFWIGPYTNVTMTDVPLLQGELNFDSISDDLHRLHFLDTDTLELLGSEILFVGSSSLVEKIIKFFGVHLGKKICGLISYSAYQGIMDEFEEKANENADYKPFRAMVHKFQKPEPFDEDAVQYHRYCDNTLTKEEESFVSLSMTILKCKAIAMHDKYYSSPLNSAENIEENINEKDVSEIFSIPYIGYFDSLTSDYAKSVFDKKMQGLNGGYRKFGDKVYEALKKYIAKSKEAQKEKEKALISKASDCIKAAFDECKTTEEKLALARAYAFDKKSELVPNGLSLLSILGIKNTKIKELTQEEKLLRYYILSLYYTRPVLKYIIAEPMIYEWSSGRICNTGLTHLTFMDPPGPGQYDYIRCSCTSSMYNAIQNRKKFENLAKKMGVTLKKPEDPTELYIITNYRHPSVEPILIAKHIETEGGVIGTAVSSGEWLQVTPEEVLKKGHYGSFIKPTPSSDCKRYF